MKGWLDKYGKEINANEGHSSAQDNWVGEGYSNVGRDYSPAWGGQFQKGGRQPMYTEDPRKVQSYNDSLNLYNRFKDAKSNYTNFISSQGFNPSYIEEWSTDGWVDQSIHPKIGAIKYGILDNSGGGMDRDIKGTPRYYNSYPTKSGKDQKVYEGSDLSNNIGKRYPIYKKPVQSYILQPEPSLKKKVTKAELLKSNKTNTPGITELQHPDIQIPPIQQGKYRVEYFDPSLKEETHRMFMTQAESDAYADELSKRNLTGVPSAGNITQRVEYQKGGKLTAEQLDSLNRAKMKSKIALASEFGNPAARRMMNPTPPSYRFSGNEMIDGQNVVGFGENQVQLPATGTHYMGSMGEYAVPYIQQSASGNLQFNPNASPDDREAMKFDNPQDAEYFAEHYKEVAPMMQSFAMGGSLPGSVGFTYARTAGSAPSNGPYAKKTKASAQDGKTIVQNLNLPTYEEGPKNFLTGYGYGFSPDPNVKVYGVGAYGETKVSPRTTLSGNMSSQSVTYPGGDRMFMKPTYNVGMRYRFDNGGSMSYYQHGLDWKPKSMQTGGWLDKYTPQAQTGDFILPRYDMPRPATSSTAITYNRPRGAVSTSTTGQKKEDVKTSTESMGRVKQREREEEKARVKERQSAKAIKEGKAKTFTFPTGESKSLDQMDAREKAYVTGKSIEGKGRFFENEESIIDDLNPLNWITEAAGSIGTAPYEARESDSNLPYAGAVGNALFQGALGVDPLGGAMKVPGKIAQSMESGLLSKAHTINPWAFKPKSTSAYRMIGDEKGLANALESGYLKPSTVGSDIGKIHAETHFQMGAPSDKRKYFGRPWDRGYPGPYMAEVPNALTDSRITPVNTFWGSGKELGDNVITFPENYIPTSEANLYKQDWLRGYKEVPRKEEGGVIKDDMGQWAHPGKVTKINSNQITMRGVPYPVLGISDAGDQQMMYPEQEYKFKGKTVTEYPQKKKNGGWLEKYN